MVVILAGDRKEIEKLKKFEFIKVEGCHNQRKKTSAHIFN